MAEYPSLPLWTDAYLGDTMHLGLEEHGAYLKLLMIAWRSKDCCLHDDDVKLARMLGVTVDRWRHRLRPVIEPFWTVADGFWTQKRLQKEREKLQNYSEVQRERAKKRWPAKSLNGQEPGGAGALPARGMPARPSPSPSPYPEDSTGGGSVPPSRTRAHEAAAAIPAASRIPLEVDFLERVEAGGGDPFAAAQVLAAWKAEFAGDGYAATLRLTLASARSNPLALAELKFGDLRRCRQRGEAEARQQQNNGWSADALMAAAARRQIAERDEAAAWPVVTECPRLGGPP